MGASTWLDCVDTPDESPYACQCKTCRSQRQGRRLAFYEPCPHASDARTAGGRDGGDEDNTRKEPTRG
jgi:hypothetical protein